MSPGKVSESFVSNLLAQIANSSNLEGCWWLNVLQFQVNRKSCQFSHCMALEYRCFDVKRPHNLSNLNTASSCHDHVTVARDPGNGTRVTKSMGAAGVGGGRFVDPNSVYPLK